VQTLFQVRTIAYRPKVCVNPGCSEVPKVFPSAGWQRVAPKHSTYGYDVIAQIGWERQKGQVHFDVIQTQLAARVDISESHVRYLCHLDFLTLE
jgi:hypothetical protein